MKTENKKETPFLDFAIYFAAIAIVGGTILLYVQTHSDPEMSIRNNLQSMAEYVGLAKPRPAYVVRSRGWTIAPVSLGKSGQVMVFTSSGWEWRDFKSVFQDDLTAIYGSTSSSGTPYFIGTGNSNFTQFSEAARNLIQETNAGIDKAVQPK